MLSLSARQSVAQSHVNRPYHCRLMHANYRKYHRKSPSWLPSSIYLHTQLLIFSETILIFIVMARTDQSAPTLCNQCYCSVHTVVVLFCALFDQPICIFTGLYRRSTVRGCLAVLFNSQIYRQSSCRV